MYMALNHWEADKMIFYDPFAKTIFFLSIQKVSNKTPTLRIEERMIEVDTKTTKIFY